MSCLNPVPIFLTRTVVCIIGENALASEYLCSLLSTPLLVPVLFEDFVDSIETHEDRLVFLIDTSGLDFPVSSCICKLRALHPESLCLLLLNDMSQHMLYDLICLDINGIICYEDVKAMLVCAIAALSATDLWCPPSLCTQVHDAFRAQSRRTRFLSTQPLTCREYDTVHLVRQRLSNKEIAGRLGIQESTVKYYLANVFCKLNIYSRSELLVPSHVDVLWRKLASRVSSPCHLLETITSVGTGNQKATDALDPGSASTKAIQSVDGLSLNARANGRSPGLLPRVLHRAS
jgi:DNA-binding NarL/FixJ family response regulator